MWALSYIGANWALILVVALGIIALGAVAWFAKNWKVAVAALLILGAGLAYQHIDKTAYQRRVSEEAAERLAVLQRRLDAVNTINQAHVERAIDRDFEACDAFVAGDRRRIPAAHGIE
ncbi:MAG: hypothetical protein G4V63_26980, partial [Candidatus Afipia apatlaquensis]|nr:hypothetical protein [Candidatus Afipia apatlaquensis]